MCFIYHKHWVYMESTANAKMTRCTQKTPCAQGAVLSTLCELIGCIWFSQTSTKEVSAPSTKWFFTSSAGPPTHIFAPSAGVNFLTFLSSKHKSCHLCSEDGYLPLYEKTVTIVDLISHKCFLFTSNVFFFFCIFPLFLFSCILSSHFLLFVNINPSFYVLVFMS